MVISRLKSRAWNSSLWIPLLALALLIGASLLAYWKTLETHWDQSQAEFNTLSLQATQQIQERIIKYEAAVEAGRTLFRAFQPVERRQWDAFVEGLDLERHFPGMGGMGVVFRVPQNVKQKFEETQRATGFPHFLIRPEGERPYYDVITYMFRVDRGTIPIGFDILTDPLRTEASERAARSNNFAVSKRLLSLQTQKPGFALFLPLLPIKYQAPELEIGWVFGAIQMEGFLRGIQTQNPLVDFEIFDGEVGTETRMFSTFNGKAPIQVAGIQALSHRMSLDVAGRKWILQFYPTPAFLATLDPSRPRLVLTGGILVSLLVFWLLRSLTTARIRAERSLISSQSYVAQILHAVPTLICSITLDGNIRFVNPAVTRMARLSKDELSGQPWMELFCPVEPYDTWDHIYRQFENNCVIFLETSLAASDAEDKVIQWEFCQRLDEKQRPVEVIAIGTDVTERKKLEEMKNEFISTVSHELRTPLTSLGGSLQLLRDGSAGPLGEDAQSLVKMALRNSDRLVRLINDLLDVEKLAAQRLSFQMASVDLLELVRHSAEANSGYAQQLGVQILTELLPEPCPIWADADRMMQVMANLLSNAAKFSPRGAKVTVAMEKADGKVRVMVRDRGRGIPKGFQDKIFNRFAQAQASDARLQGGAGLGLYISKEIVERHGGRIGFNSQEGLGTEFFFELPVFTEKAAAPRTLSAEGRLSA